MIRKIKEYILFFNRNKKQELAIIFGWVGVAIIWYGSNWIVAIGVCLALAAQTYLTSK